jgi:membrane protein implicated in regulation of membrane protease activity
MNIQFIYLLCFVVGAVWTLTALLLGGFHFGHHGLGPGQTDHGHAWHGGDAQSGQDAPGGPQHDPMLFGYLVNPSCVAVFLAWFGGVGYLLARHTGLGFWAALCIAAGVGLSGAWMLASFLRFLTSREQPLDPADYEIVGVLGRVSVPIRPGGVGELIYVRDGTRRALCARAEEGQEIGRNEEVVVMRYEKGIAYVRTWDAVTRQETNHLQRE